MLNLIKLKETKQIFAKPNAILQQLDNLLTQSIAASLNQVEELIMDQLERLAIENDPRADLTEISFSVEVIEHKFKFIPNNFYTFLLSEGVYVPYDKVKDRKYIQYKGNEYYFNILEKYGVCINKQQLEAINESHSVQRKSRNPKAGIGTSNQIQQGLSRSG